MYKIFPYKGTADIQFGMSKTDVAAVLGAPMVTRENILRQTEMRYRDMCVVFDANTETVVEIMIYPTAIALMGEIDVFNDPESFNKMIAADGDPYLCEDVIVLKRIGVAINDYRVVEDRNEKQLTLFANGHWDNEENSLRKFVL